MKIGIGADHRGSEVVKHLAASLQADGHEVQVLGSCGERVCDYPDMAWPVARAVAAGACDRGILVCGSGIGMCIAANKVAGVRAALVHDEVGAESSRRHNNSNILCLSADMLGPRAIDGIVSRWLVTEFEGGRHQRRIRKIAAIEQGMDPGTVKDENGA